MPHFVIRYSKEIINKTSWLEPFLWQSLQINLYLNNNSTTTTPDMSFFSKGKIHIKCVQFS